MPLDTTATTDGKEKTDAGPQGATSTTDKAAASTATTDGKAASGDKTAATAVRDPKTTSVLAGGDDDGDETEVTTPANWPDDWREKLVASISDEKVRDKELKQLQRMKSPGDVVKAYRALQTKLSSGEYKRALADDATPEEKAAWRKENSIPEKAEEYTLPEIAGHEWGEADKPILESFLADLHAGDAPQALVDKALGWYAKFQEQQAEAIFTRDATDKQGLEDTLRSEWGPEFRANMNRVRQFLTDKEQGIPEGFAAAIENARLPSGQRLIHADGVLPWLATLAVNAYGANSMPKGEQIAMGNRKDEIEKIMKTNMAEYRAKGLDKEYAGILEREEKTGRGRAA